MARSIQCVHGGVFLLTLGLILMFMTLIIHLRPERNTQDKVTKSDSKDIPSLVINGERRDEAPSTKLSQSKKANTELWKTNAILKHYIIGDHLQKANKFIKDDIFPTTKDLTDVRMETYTTSMELPTTELPHVSESTREPMASTDAVFGKTSQEPDGTRTDGMKQYLGRTVVIGGVDRMNDSPLLNRIEAFGGRMRLVIGQRGGMIGLGSVGVPEGGHDVDKVDGEHGDEEGEELTRLHEVVMPLVDRMKTDAQFMKRAQGWMNSVLNSFKPQQDIMGLPVLLDPHQDASSLSVGVGMSVSKLADVPTHRHKRALGVVIKGGDTILADGHTSSSFQTQPTVISGCGHSAKVDADVLLVKHKGGCFRDLAIAPMPWMAGTRLNLFVDLKFRCDGEVTGWTFYAYRTGTFIAGVWRKVGRWRKAKYRLVGKTGIIVRTIGTHTVHLKDELKIKFKSGDVLGIHYPNRTGNGVIPYADTRYADLAKYGYTYDDVSRVIAFPRAHAQLASHGVPARRMNRRVKRLPALVPVINGAVHTEERVTPKPEPTSQINAPVTDNTVCSTHCFPHMVVSESLPERPTRHLNIFTDIKFRCAGNVAVWSFYALRAGSVFAAVWRPKGKGYTLVGKNEMKAIIPGAHKLHVDADAQIKVKEGDVIGIHYMIPGRHGVIPYARDNIANLQIHGLHVHNLSSVLQMNAVDDGLPLGHYIHKRTKRFKRLPSLFPTLLTGQIEHMEAKADEGTNSDRSTGDHEGDDNTGHVDTDDMDVVNIKNEAYDDSEGLAIDSKISVIDDIDETVEHHAIRHRGKRAVAELGKFTDDKHTTAMPFPSGPGYIQAMNGLLSSSIFCGLLSLALIMVYLKEIERDHRTLRKFIVALATGASAVSAISSSLQGFHVYEQTQTIPQGPDVMFILNTCACALTFCATLCITWGAAPIREEIKHYHPGKEMMCEK